MTTSKVNPDPQRMTSSKAPQLSKSSKNPPRESANILPLKVDSGSEDIYPTSPVNHEKLRIFSSIHQKQRTSQPPVDPDEESRAMINQNKPLLDRPIPPSTHSATYGMGDHHSKQHRTRSKTASGLHRKHHRQDSLELLADDRQQYHWRFMMYILTILVLVFVIYRLLLALWPKPQKTLMEQFLDDLSTLFTA